MLAVYFLMKRRCRALTQVADNRGSKSRRRFDGENSSAQIRTFVFKAEKKKKGDKKIGT